MPWVHSDDSSKVKVQGVKEYIHHGFTHAGCVAGHANRFCSDLGSPHSYGNEGRENLARM